MTFWPLGIATASQSRRSVTGSWGRIVNSFSVAGTDSVDTGTCSPSNAARIVCQARLAHFTREGNCRTPAKTASLPSLTGCSLTNARR